jgi:hypothetical protein
MKGEDARPETQRPMAAQRPFQGAVPQKGNPAPPEAGDPVTLTAAGRLGRGVLD